MDFLSELFSGFGSKESIQVLLWLVIAGLIGFITAWIYWNRRYEKLNNQAVAAERDAAELRIRNTELAMNAEESRKEAAEANLKMMDMETAIRKLKEEKGQMYADLMAARGDLDTKPKVSKATSKETSKEPEVQLDNLEAVAKSALQLSGNEPIIEDAHAALQKKSSEEQQKESADFIKNAMGSRIKKVSAKQKDNLQLIKGVGPFIEGKLNNLGLYSFEQISALDDELIEKLTEAIQFFPGRIERDDWVGQAKELMDS